MCKFNLMLLKNIKPSKQKLQTQNCAWKCNIHAIQEIHATRIRKLQQVATKKKITVFIRNICCLKCTRILA